MGMQLSGSSEPSPPSARERATVRFVTRYSAVVVLVAMTTLSLGGFVVARRSLREQERRLLHERSSEVAALLTNSISSTTPTMEMLGDVYNARRAVGTIFTATASSLVKGNVTAIGVAEMEGDSPVVRGAQGATPPAGESLSGARAEVVARATQATGLVSSIIADDATGKTLLVLALETSGGQIVYQESVIDPTRPAPATPDSPYHNLNVALYRSPEPRPEDLLLTTRALTEPTSRSDRRELTVGSEHWLMVTSSPEGLGGAFGRAVPWITLLGGLAASLVVAGVVWLFARRRNYAMALVEQRTADLQQTMHQLDAAREAAESANASKTVFLSRMSHELRTPLNAVLGFTQLLELSELDAEQRDGVQQILKGGSHLLTLINEVLDISRIESGDFALSSEAVLVSDVVEEALDLMGPLAAQQSITLNRDRRGCGTYVFADRQRLKQIMLNLISNAVKYNRVAGTVTVTCSQSSPTRMRLNVTDTGPGIAPDKLSLLFVPFERLGAERSDIDGVGIGLALSRRLAEAMGGALDVETSIGQGSTFWVELPLVEGPVDRYERLNDDGPEAKSNETAASSRPTVLYIEDNIANLKLVERIFRQRTDLNLITAIQGRLGVELAKEHHPSLVLLDLHLPDIQGDEVLQQLRDDAATAATPVVILSADATPGRVQRLLTAGASGYLTKPLNVRELLRTVDDLLGQHEAVRVTIR